MSPAASKDPAADRDVVFLEGGGALGALIRRYDWSRTSLGPLEAWPASLKTATALLLRSPVPIVLLWGEDGVMIYNDAYSVFAGGRHPKLLGSKVREGWPEVADFNDNVMKVGLAGGTLAYRDQELTLYRRGVPEQVWMNLDYSPVLGEDGKPAGVIAIVVETTEKVLAERRIAAEHARLQQMFEQAPGIMALLRGPEHVFELVNPAYLQLVGRSDVIGKPVREALPEVVGQGFIDLLDHVYRTGKAYVGTGMRLTLRRGEDSTEERFVDFVYQPITDSAGIVSGIFVQGSDVTQHMRGAAALRESEGRFRALVNAISDVIYRMSPDWTEMLQLLGRDFLADTPGPKQNWNDDYIHPDDRQMVRDAIDKAIDTNSIFQLEHRVRRLDGSWGWTLSRAVPLFDDDGKVTEWFGAASDVSARKFAEEALRESEARFRLIVESAEEFAIFTSDFAGRVTSWNSGAERILGYTADEIIGESGAVIFTEEDRQAGLPEAEMRNALAAGNSEDERWHLRKDGSRFWASGLMMPLKDDSGQPRGYLKILRDRTDRKQVEEQRKLLIDELNHRVKNTLATVQSIAAQTFRGEAVKSRAAFDARLLALSKAHDLLTRENWEGVGLRTLVADVLAPYGGGTVDGARIAFAGENVRLRPRTALALSMALHELAVNAAKYGALCGSRGAVSLGWEVVSGRLMLLWKEQGGPPVSPPTSRGFGSRLIEKGLARELDGIVKLDFAPDGVVCRIDVPAQQALL